MEAAQYPLKTVQSGDLFLDQGKLSLNDSISPNR